MTQTVTVKLKPPSSFVQDCHTPTMAGRTNGDLWIYKLELETALAECNANMAKLREWGESDDVKKDQ